MAGAGRGGELLPGLPVSALAAVCPAAAAAILIYRNSRAAGVAAFAAVMNQIGAVIAGS